MKRKLIALFVVLFPIAAVVPASAAANKLLNAGFESSVLEPPGFGGILTSPVLPTDWVFEGSAGLFDHGDDRADVIDFSPERKCFGSSECGGRFIAISIPASTNKEVCDANTGCVDNPAELVKEATKGAYQINPHWRNAVPVTVSAGSTYTLSFWLSGELITEGEGATTSVRFYDFLGVPISLVQGPQRRASAAVCLNASSSTQPCPWAKLSATMVAPQNAASAVVLLGHTSDLFIGQVRFDSVFFG